MVSTLQPNHRRPTPGPESALVDGFLADGLGSLGSGDPISLLEPEIALAYPDVVLVYRTNRSPKNPARPWSGQLSADHFRVLHHLRSLNGAGAGRVASDLNFPPTAATRLLNALVAANFVTKRGSSYRSRPAQDIFPVTRIVAVEAKVSHWQKALRQAERNLWFASHSYVLLPERTVKPQVIEAAQAVSVGLLAHTPRGTRRVLAAPRHQLPASYASWLVLCWTMSA